MDEVDREVDGVDDKDEDVDGFNKSAVTDVWTRECQLVEKDNVKQMRQGQAARLQRKKLKNHALRMHIQRQKANVGSCSLKDECPTSQEIHPYCFTVLKKYVKK
jgi:hypothetical protein